MANVQIVRAAVIGVYGGPEALVQITRASVLGGIPAGRVQITRAAVLSFSPTAGSGAVKITRASVLSPGYDPNVQGVVRFMRAAVVGASTGQGIVRVTRAAVLSESVAPSHRRLYVMVGTTPVAARYGLVQGSTPVYF